MSMRTIARSSSNRNSASALASSVLPTPVGPRNRNEPVGPVGVGDAGARPADGVGHRADGVGLADDPPAEPVLHPQQLLRLALEQPAGGDAGPGLDDVGDVVGADLLLEHRLAGLHRLLGRLQRPLELGQPAVAELRGAGEVAVPLGALGVEADVLQLLLDPLDALDRGLVLLPAEGQLGQLLAAVGELLAERGQPLQGGLVVLLAQRHLLDLHAGGRRARPRRPRRGGCRSPSAAGWRPRRRGRSPCPGGSGP